MANLVLSMMKQENTDVVALLRPLLDRFQSQRYIDVELQPFSWSDGQEEFLKTVLYGSGPNVSEVGTTWVSSFLGMNGLQPFTDREIRMIGDPEDFLEPIWQVGCPPGRERMWAIPWVAGTRVLYYRRDLLAKTGIAETEAFKGHLKFQETLAALQELGDVAPWVVPTQPTLNTLHYAASWIWDAGGDFINEQEKQILFNTEESYAGLLDYFKLGQYLPQSGANLDDATVERLFWHDGQAAVTVGGHWLVRSQQEIASPMVLNNLGIAPMPGIPFIGGSTLVVWEHTRNKQDAIELIHFLVSAEVQSAYNQAVGLLPVRHSVLAQPPFSDDPNFKIAVEGLKTGRTFSSSAMWNVIERRLTDALGLIWKDWLADSEGDLMAIIARHLDPLARRLDITLRSR